MYNKWGHTEIYQTGERNVFGIMLQHITQGKHIILTA